MRKSDKKRKVKRRVKHIFAKSARYSKAESEAMHLPDPISPVEFLKVIRLPQKDNIKTELDMELTPYLKAPIKRIADYRVQTIIIIAPTQSGKTVVIQVAVAWSIDQDPGPLLYSLPDEKTAKRLLEEKIVNMIRETPCLRKRIRSLRDVSRSGIKLDSMTIFPAWSHSIPTYGSSPKKRVVSDEVRLFDLAIGKESNALKLSDDRLTTYKNMGIGQHIMVSSPSSEGDLLHQQLDIPGTTILKWHVPCPECDEYQLLDFFVNVKKPDKNHKEARCICKFCGANFTDTDRKKSWNNLGTYAPEGHVITKDNAVPGDVVSDIKDTSRIVFWWDSCVSPFRSFNQMQDEYRAAKDKPHDYINFLQCWLARFRTMSATKTSVDKIKTHKDKSYVKGEVPGGVRLLMTGIDTQDDSLYYVVLGFGFYCEVWLIDENMIPCEMETTTWIDLQGIVKGHILDKHYLGKNGETWKVGFGSWDSGGHRTKEVYMAVRSLRGRIVAMRGHHKLTRSVLYSKKETHYNIRRDEYLAETEHKMSAEKDFHLPHNVSFDFMRQFANMQRQRTPDRSGKSKWSWSSTGDEHFRMACVYAFACLDISLGKRGDFRGRLRDKSFKLNPKITAKQETDADPVEDKGKEDPFKRRERIQGHRSREHFKWK